MNARKQNIVGVYPNAEPEIGRWLWALEDSRQRTLEELAHVSPEMLDWQPPDGESTIATILYHIADIEADWLYAEVLEQDWPPEVAALFPDETRDAQGQLTQVRGFSLDQHLSRLSTVRALLLATYQPMALADFRRARALPYYDVTPEWVLHHLMQHEAEHRSQIGALRRRIAL
jgi:uncharacterized damage-inducible protein DinB